MRKYVISPGDRPAYIPEGHQGFINYPLIDKDTGAKYMEAILGVTESPGGALADAHEAEEQALYVLEGRISVDVEGEKEEAKAGDIVFFPQGKMHEITTLDTPYRALVIYAPPRKR